MLTRVFADTRSLYDNLQQNMTVRTKANPLDPVLGHHTARERLPTAVPEITNDQARQPPSTVMLKMTRNILKPQAEKIIAEEQAGFRAGRSTTEQTFDLRILCEKHLQHLQDLYHVFIHFKKAFDRVLHGAL